MKSPTTRWTQLAHAMLHGDSAGQLARVEVEYGERKRAEGFALLLRFLPGSAAPPMPEGAGRVLQLSAGA
jgi:hypothetical protein